MNEKSESRIFELSKIRQSPAIGQVVFFPTLDSTNDWAKEYCQSRSRATDLPEFPLLVLTDSQIAGRGQGSNRWVSDSGSLTFSYVLEAEKFDDSVNSKSLIPLAAGLAVADSIDELIGGAAQIKWPNDVIFKGKKVAGVLTESISLGDFIIIGIGVNLSTALDGGALPFAGAIVEQHEQLATKNESRVDATEFLVHLLGRLQNQLVVLHESPEEVVDAVDRKSWLTGKRVEIQSGKRKVVGLVHRINEHGGLVVDTSSKSDGTTFETVISGHEVRILA